MKSQPCRDCGVSGQSTFCNNCREKRFKKLCKEHGLIRKDESTSHILKETTRKKERLTCCGLFSRTGRVWSIGDEKNGRETGIGSLTYQMDEINFTRFVEELETLATTKAALHALMKREVWPLNGAEKTERLENPSPAQLRLETLLIKQRVDFEGRYEPALDILIYERQGSPYYNLEFFPRPRKAQALFLRFVNAYMRFLNIERLKLAGAPSETRSLDDVEQALANKMSREDKEGPTFIAEEIGLEKRKLSDATWKRKQPSIVKNVKRHLRRNDLKSPT